MARKQEPLTFAGALEVQAQKPLDARRKLSLISDLTDAESFPYIYKGLDVFCEENDKWYTFLGGDQTDINNWRVEGSGGGGSTDWSDITNKPTDLVQDAAYQHTDNNFADADKAKVDDTYTKAQTDQKIAEGIATVDSEHFHPVTVLPDVADAKENHEYILIEYEQDGVTIKSKKFYLFYDGAYHEDRAAGVSLDGYATEQYVDDGLATKQDTLVSGTNVKTVNGESLLGAGNIVAGMNLEVGVEKWYGTYTADGVTYQVYSKLLDIGALPSAAGVTQYPHGITGIKQILQISGFTNDGFVMNAPRQNAQDNISIYQAQKSGNIAVEVGKDRSSKSGFVMLIYAKNN